MCRRFSTRGIGFGFGFGGFDRRLRNATRTPESIGRDSRWGGGDCRVDEFSVEEKEGRLVESFSRSSSNENGRALITVESKLRGEAVKIRIQRSRKREASSFLSRTKLSIENSSEAK